MNSPLVSILMTAYNSERYIARAVQSVLAQTLIDFELIVIDDGSTDATPQILDGFQRSDRRITVHHGPHRGIVPSANQGLELCRAEYIARLDADDICLPNRFKIQSVFLANHPDVVIVGSSAIQVGENDRFLRLSLPPLSDSEIRTALLLDNPFSTSTVMMRTAALRENSLAYDPAFVHAEDYEFWSRLLEFGKGRNLPEPAACLRIHPQQRSTREFDDCLAYAERVARRNIARIGCSFTPKEVRKLRLWDRVQPSFETQEDLQHYDRVLELCSRLAEQAWADPDCVSRYRTRWLLRLATARTRTWAGFQVKAAVLRQFKPGDLVWAARYLKKRTDYLRIRQRIAGTFQHFAAASIGGSQINGPQRDRQYVESTEPGQSGKALQSDPGEID